MAFNFFENIIRNNIDTNPDTMYRDIEQAFIDEQWDNTSAKYEIEEQMGLGVDEYAEIEAWITPTVADTSTGLKDTGDFLKVAFRDVTHETMRGLMYKFDNNYWLVHSYAPYNGIAQYCGIRRCNNVLKIVDPMNGGIFSIPCVIDYDMAASTAQVSRYIITPNNHAVVMVQGNTDTLRLFKTNTRFMLSGRPFKLLGYQNAVNNADMNMDTLLYLDLYLDELRDGDNIEIGVADNGRYDYTIEINAENLTMPSGTSGTFTAKTMLNGAEVERGIIWATDDEDIIDIKDNGEYEIIGTEIGSTAIVYATLSGNADVVDNIEITIGAIGADVKIVTSPAFDRIRQYQSIPFNIEVYYNNELIESGVTYSADTDSDYVDISADGYGYVLTCHDIATEPQIIKLTVHCDDPAIDAALDIAVKTVSLIG